MIYKGFIDAKILITDTVIKTTKVIGVKSGEVVLETKEEVEEIPQPFDTIPLFFYMRLILCFPKTHHVEAVSLLVKE